MNDVVDWLRSLGLEEYAQAFVSQHVDFELLKELSDSDLRELGIASLGHRKRLIKGIAELKTRPAPAPTVATSPSLSPHGKVAGERRQLSVMFCDLVGSTALSEQLDPEDLQHVVRGYHDAVAEAVRPYEGYIAQFLGDGVLVYFGYPHAHEDDAERAVRAALDVVRSIAASATQHEVALRTRIGVATGAVVVDEIRAGASSAEPSAVGDTPNLAARLQGIAKPGSIVIAERTQRLVNSMFELRSLGQLELKGFSAPVPAWCVLGERSVDSRFEGQHPHKLNEFVGRDGELLMLLQRWTMARDGEGQVVLVTGEAGIGKSRLSRALRDRIASDMPAVVLLQCSSHFHGSALHPVVRHLERVAGLTATDDPQERIRKLEKLAKDVNLPSPEARQFLLQMMSGGVPESTPTSPQAEKARTLNVLVELALGLAANTPLLLLIEDAHWIDSTTEEWIAQLIDRLRDARVLMLITCRPEYSPAWANAGHLTRITLGRLSHAQCASLVHSAAGNKALPADVLAEILRKTDGIPLFVEELTKMVIGSKLVDETPTGYQLRGAMTLGLAIPSTLQDSLRARFDQLEPAKEVAQWGATIGREFSYRLLAALPLPGPRLDEALEALVRSEIVSRRGAGIAAVYTFRHALIRDTAYESMLKSQRVMRHGMLARAFEETLPETASAQPEVLAHHHQEGGHTAEAFRYWSAAGALASRRSAGREAALHYGAALRLLPDLDATQRSAETEFDLQMNLGTALTQTVGFRSAETHRCFSIARELASTLGELDRFVFACNGLAPTLYAAGRFDEVLDMLGRLDSDQLSELRPMSHVVLSIHIGIARLHRGELGVAWANLSEAISYMAKVEPGDRQLCGGAEMEVPVLAYAARVRVVQGFLDEAEALVKLSLAIAEKMDHAPTLAWALQMAAWIATVKGEFEQAAQMSLRVLEISDELGIKTRSATGTFYRGYALVATGGHAEGASLLHAGYSQWATFGGKFHCTEYAAYAANVLVDAGLREEALKFVLLGEKVQEESDERFFQAELLRLRGRLCELDGNGLAAADCYRRSIDAAELQGAKLLSLRAATNLAVLLQSGARGGEGHKILQSTYGRFTEGFDFPDLIKARSILQRF